MGGRQKRGAAAEWTSWHGTRQVSARHACAGAAATVRTALGFESVGTRRLYGEQRYPSSG